MFCVPVFSLILWFFSLSNFVIRSRGIMVAAPPLDSPCGESSGNLSRGQQKSRKILKRKQI
jgi:hypothetical protein